MTLPRRLPAVALLALCALLLAACGASGEDAAGNGVDRAFAKEMIPHHRSAVEMAEIAGRRAERPELKALAGDIVRAQESEIATLERVDRDLAADGVKTGDLGVAHHDMGMDGDAAMLQDAEPFDRAFVEMMVPHHEGAIRMARTELAEGEHPELKRLARAIVAEQAREIEAMRALQRPTDAE